MSHQTRPIDRDGSASSRKMEKHFDQYTASNRSIASLFSIQASHLSRNISQSNSAVEHAARCLIFMLDMTKDLSQSHRETIPHSRPPSAPFASLPFPWAGQIQSLSSTTTSPTSYKPKFPTSLFPISTTSLVKAQNHVTFDRMDPSRLSLQTPAFVDSFGSTSRTSIASYSE